MSEGIACIEQTIAKLSPPFQVLTPPQLRRRLLRLCRLAHRCRIHRRPELPHDDKGVQGGVIDDDSDTRQGLDRVPAPLLACPVADSSRGGIGGSNSAMGALLQLAASKRRRRR